MEKHEGWKLKIGKTGKPRIPAKPNMPSGGSTSGGNGTGGISAGEKVDMLMRGFESVSSLITTFAQERRKNAEMKYAHEEELKRIDASIKHDEEETKRIIADSIVELEKYRIDAESKRIEIMTGLEERRMSHAREMEALRNAHREKMRMIDCCERVIIATTSLCDKYRQPACAALLTENVFEQMNSSLVMLSEMFGKLSLESAPLVIESKAQRFE